MDIDTEHMAQFQLGYIGLIVNQAAAICGEPRIDRDSIDLSISGMAKNFNDCLFNKPQIDVQLKATTEKLLIKDNHIHYPLKTKNYNELATLRSCIPKYLFVMLLPDDPNLWVNYQSNCSLVFERCYWISLKGAEPTENAETKTIKIPIENSLCFETIKKMLTCAANDEVMSNG